MASRQALTIVLLLSLLALVAPGRAEESRHWAFAPLSAGPLPPVRDRTWPLAPTDHFILSRLEEHGLLPLASAEKQKLLRRASFDLTGLPPSPEEMEVFLADSSPGAFASAVDRLLASPRFGERWGRHWLDVVRYADTAGNAPDFPVPQAWRYRNYVIEAFRRDKPFDRFVREQIAGDLMAEHAASPDERTVATGYLAIHRRFYGSTDGPDHLEIEDILDTLGRSLLGLSLSCARCHDHKFDLISTSEYYSLYGIFSSTRYPFPGAEGMAAQKNFVALTDGAEAYAAGEGAAAHAKVQEGGDPGQLREESPRGFLHVLGGQKLSAEATGSGRLELADWLTSPQCRPLLARVMANRVWRGLFGKGLVETPNDFGVRGELPTHPELLDYLASQLIESGWSIKTLLRSIVLSHVYQVSSQANSQNSAIDPANRWLWRFPRRRLDAEAIRDAMLCVAGQLDESMGGEHPFPSPSTWSFSQHAPFDAVYETNRRSVYLMQQRIKRHPYLALFDGPDPNASTAARRPTTTPLQALFAMNDEFIHSQGGGFAERVVAAAPDERGRVSAAYELALSRPPEPHEIEACREHLARFQARAIASGCTEEEAERMAWTSLARVLLVGNEFFYID